MHVVCPRIPCVHFKLVPSIPSFCLWPCGVASFTQYLANTQFKVHFLICNQGVERGKPFKHLNPHLLHSFLVGMSTWMPSSTLCSRSANRWASFFVAPPTTQAATSCSCSVWACSVIMWLWAWHRWSSAFILCGGGAYVPNCLHSFALSWIQLFIFFTWITKHVNNTRNDYFSAFSGIKWTWYFLL